MQNLTNQSTVMIVDDTPANLKLLQDLLHARGYRVLAFPGGAMAIEAALRSPPDLILLDVNMPELNGYEVCARLKASPATREIPVLFISALGETSDKMKAFSAGGLDYVTKPFQFEEVHARVETHLRLHLLQRELEKYNLKLGELVQEKVKEISQSQLATIVAMSKLAESRDDDTGHHIERTRTFCRILAQKLGENPRHQRVIDDSFNNNIYNSAPLHDIGKVGISDNILLKPGKLTPEEFEIMKTHAAIGADTLQVAHEQYPNNSFLRMGVFIARSHHEKYDGSGYPDGLAGEDIPLCARIMAVADVYDALRSVRPYKPAFSHEKSCEIIREGAGRHFDPDVFEAFTAVRGEFDRIRNELDISLT